MDAKKLFEERFTIQLTNGKTIVVFMDLYQLTEQRSKFFPEGYKFSWIAFDIDNPEHRVLFDCHPPKGPHVHIDGDPKGMPFEWKGLEIAQTFFFKKVKERFGPFMDEEEL